jgi:hypothetical protein
MLWAESGRVRNHAARAVFSSLFLLYAAACHAQSEPPLDVPRAGALQGHASSGCDAGLGAAPGLGTAPAKSGSAGGNNTSDLGVPLYSVPDAGTNVPLYSNPLAGDNAPLYSIPDPGNNSPLYSNNSLSNYSNLSGGGLSPVSNVGPTACRSGIPVGEWLLYPSIRLYSIYSDNLFLAPSNGINALGFGATPSLTAQWTNGIHSTTIFANVDTQRYPTFNLIDTFDRQATFTQSYTPLPDMTFTAVGDYSHKTVTGSLTNSIPDVISTPVTTPTLLPNGNIELPNGEIVSPTGQVVGNINGPSGANGISVVNPYDQYTGTATVNKIFNGGALSLTGATAQTNYQLEQNAGTASSFSSFTTKTFSESGSFWLGPVLYAYSSGTFSMRSTATEIDPNSDAYRVTGGIGTRQFGLFRSSIYFGYQGSKSDGSGAAGGQLYGAKVSYYPTLAWTITVAIDETVNKAPAGASSMLALSVDSPVQIPLSSSTRITHPSLQTQYQIAPKWTAVGNFNYTQIDYYGSPRVDHAWQADAQLSYDVWRNMTLDWEYGYTTVISNAPGQNAKRNLIMMSANYRF